MIFNCHTHIGDAFIKLKKKYSLEELVAPNGYKHYMLNKAKEEEILMGMDKAIEIMERCNTDVFIDFREGGIKGVKILKKALEGKKIKAIILARPEKMEYSEKEIEKLLEISHGIGLSSYSDWGEDEIKLIAEHIKARKKIFAMHASEGKREDIGKILDLKPDFLVHLCRATEDDINEIVRKGIGIVVCPRANAYFGLKPPLKILMEKKAIVMLGTDNAMIVKPNIIEEMEYTVKNFGIRKEEAFKMISKNPSKFFGEILKNHVYS